MMFNKKISFMAVFIILLSIVLSGCGRENTPTVSVGSNGYTVIDSTGQKLEFTDPPKRIASLSVSVDEILLDLIPPDRIVALTGYADDPGISAVPDKAKAVKGRIRSKSIEEIITLAPDLLIAPDWLSGNIIEGLKGVGLKVYVFKTPSTIAEIKKAINDIAEVTGDRTAGDNLIEKMDKKLVYVAQKMSSLEDKDRKTIVAFSLMGGAFGGKGSTFDDICKYAYIKNGVSLAGIEKYETVTKEVVVAINPDAFILPTWDYKGDGEVERYIEEIKNDPAYKNITAIKTGTLIKVNDAKMYSTSQYIVDSVEEIAQKVYPEKFKN